MHFLIYCVATSVRRFKSKLSFVEILFKRRTVVGSDLIDLPIETLKRRTIS